MKSLHYLILSMLCLGSAGVEICALESTPSVDTAHSIQIRSVNFKKCVEQSKLGKQEQASFEALKKQMEGSLAEKEKVLNDLAAKLEDPDHLDSLSPEAETEMKRKFRALNQEYSQIQSQYLQALQQTNFQIIKKLTDLVGKASEIAAKQAHFDFILNDESCFFALPQHDVSSKVISVMDEIYAKEEERAKAEASTP